MAEVMLPVREPQIVELVRQLSPEGKRTVLQVLIPDLDQFEALVDHGDERIRALCAQRGINWGTLSEEERQALIDDLLHEA